MSTEYNWPPLIEYPFSTIFLFTRLKLNYQWCWFLFDNFLKVKGCLSIYYIIFKWVKINIYTQTQHWSLPPVKKQGSLFVTHSFLVKSLPTLWKEYVHLWMGLHIQRWKYGYRLMNPFYHRYTPFLFFNQK